MTRKLNEVRIKRKFIDKTEAVDLYRVHMKHGHLKETPIRAENFNKNRTFFTKSQKPISKDQLFLTVSLTSSPTSDYNYH